jgi:hypothetical protein
MMKGFIMGAILQIIYGDQGTEDEMRRTCSTRGRNGEICQSFSRGAVRIRNPLGHSEVDGSGVLTCDVLK